MAFPLVSGMLEVYRNKAFGTLGFCVVSMSEFKYYRLENLLLKSPLPLTLPLFSQAQAPGRGLQLSCRMGLAVLWRAGSSWPRMEPLRPMLAVGFLSTAPPRSCSLITNYSVDFAGLYSRSL